MANKKTIRRRRKSRAYMANSHIIKIMSVAGIIVTLVISNVLFTMVSGKHLRSGKNVLLYKSGSGTVTEKVNANRGYIYDRNKEIIAQDIEAYDLFAYIDENRVNATNDPVHVVNFEETSEKLAPILKSEADSLLQILNNAKSQGLTQTEFREYGKNLSAQQKEDIEALGLPGLDFTKSTDRVYPNGKFASQMIGYAQYNYDDDKLTGVMGMESIFDDILSGKNGTVVYQTDSKGNYLPKTKKYTETAVNGNDVYLTLDKNVQLALEKALTQTMESNAANKAWGIVMEAETGKILAQAGYPTFDLNERENITNYQNTPAQISFECGSVIKPFVYAGAIQEGVYDGSAYFDSGSIHLGLDANGRVVPVESEEASNWVMTISDAQGKDYGMITYDEGLVRSTNTAIVNLLLRSYDLDKNIEYLKKFGFFEPVDIYGLEEDPGILVDDNIFSKITLGFGQGSRINSYQLIQAASAIFGDGTMVKPYVVDRIVNPNTGETIYKGKTETKETGVSPETTKQVQELMKKVVSEDYGTGHNYEMKDVTMMAKTGTGEVAVPGGYSRTIYTSSIMAAAPSDNPKIIVYYAFESENFLYYDVSYFQSVVREALMAVDGYNSASENTTNTQPSATFHEYTMPSLVNHTLSYAKGKLEAYTSNIVTIGDGNTIISQYPYTKEDVTSNQKVFLLTDGSNITMPNMSGWSRKDVNLYAQLTGIPIKITGSGIVSKQNVAEGTSINKDSKLSVELK